MREKGRGGVSRVPADPKLPLKYWQGTVELPRHADGRRRQKVVRSKDAAWVETEVRKLIRELDRAGDLSTREYTVAKWLGEWMDTIAVQKVRPKTANNYRSLIRTHIVPRIGSTRLNKLTPGDVRKMNADIVKSGKSSTTALQIHRILSVALTAAEREGKVSRNVCSLIDAPRKARNTVRALTLDEGIRVLRAAIGDRYESLWYAVLLTGARQGELLGLELDRVTDVIEISWQLQRLSWEHGCDGGCGMKRAASCPRRTVTFPVDFEYRHVQGGLWLTRPKSHSGWRVVPVVSLLAASLQRQIEQDREVPNPHGLVWRLDDGSAIDPRDVQDMWDALLKRAGVPDVRFHDGRHTTVDLLYEAGVPEDVIREIVGHSTREMTRGYKSRGNRKRLDEGMAALERLVSQPGDGRSGTPASLAS